MKRNIKSDLADSGSIAAAKDASGVVPDTISGGSLRIIDFLFTAVFLFLAAVSIKFFFFFLFQTINLRNVEPAGFVAIKKNSVQRRLSDRVLWDRLAVHSPVYPGDLIRIAELSAATLEIDGNIIDLSENTLIRIMLAPDGKGFQIIMNEGNLSLSSSMDSGRISVNLNGQQVLVNAESQTVPSLINVSSSDEGMTIQVLKGEARINPPKINSKEEAREPALELHAGMQMMLDTDGVERVNPVVVTQTVSSMRYSNQDSIPLLQSPVSGSVFRSINEKPAINFRWTHIDGAGDYILEISENSEFSTVQIRRQGSAAFFSGSELGAGTWYWRVKPVFSNAFTGESSFSKVSYFRIEQIAENREQALESREQSLAEWLVKQAPLETAASFEVASFLAQLPAPQNLRPAVGIVFTMNELIVQRNINFSWQAVSGANAYTLVIFQQTAGGGKRQIFTHTFAGTSYRLENLRILDNGTFIWQVEAVYRANNIIERRGNPAEGSFIIDIPLPDAIQVKGADIINAN
jgi:hypothetical protein